MPEVVVRPPDRAADGPVAFACRFSSTAGAARVTLAGELDIAAVPAFDRVLQRAAAVAPLTLASHRGARPASPAGPTPRSGCS